jgi:hypothetical protein
VLGDGGRAARRRYLAGPELRAPVRRSRVPGRTLKANIWKDGGGFSAVVTAPERDDAVALAGVELKPVSSLAAFLEFTIAEHLLRLPHDGTEDP